MATTTSSDALFVSSHNVGLISDLLQASLTSLSRFQSSDNAKKCSVQQKSSLKHISDLLFLWGDTHNVATGELDAKLQRSIQMFKLVVTILRRITKRIWLGMLHE
jgi:hypothetical protein